MAVVRLVVSPLRSPCRHCARVPALASPAGRPRARGGTGSRLSSTSVWLVGGGYIPVVGRFCPRLSPAVVASCRGAPRAALRERSGASASLRLYLFGGYASASSFWVRSVIGRAVGAAGRALAHPFGSARARPSAPSALCHPPSPPPPRVGTSPVSSPPDPPCISYPTPALLARTPFQAYTLLQRVQS